MATLEERVMKMEEDMYFGRGQYDPPVVTRLDRLERTASNVNKMTWALIFAFIAAVGDIVSHHYH